MVDDGRDLWESLTLLGGLEEDRVEEVRERTEGVRFRGRGVAEMIEEISGLALPRERGGEIYPSSARSRISIEEMESLTEATGGIRGES